MAGVITYLWQRVPDTGATVDLVTTQTYTPVAADVDSKLRVRVRDTNAAGFTDAYTPNTSRVLSSAAPPVLWRQWSDIFNGTFVDAGCSLTVESGSAGLFHNRLTATIASGLNSQDSAFAYVDDARLPTTQEGRARGYFRTPPSFNLFSGTTIFALLKTLPSPLDNMTGQESIIDFYIDSGEHLSVYATAGLLASGLASSVSSVVLASNTDYLIEIAWRRNGFIKVWLNDVLIVNITGLTGATQSAIPVLLSLGIHKYDATGSDPGWTSTMWGWQLSSDASLPLADPTFGALTQRTVATSLLEQPAIRRKIRPTRNVVLTMTPTSRWKIRTTKTVTLTLSAALRRKLRRPFAATLTLVASRSVKGKFLRAQSASLVLTSALARKPRKGLAVTETFASASSRRVLRKRTLAVAQNWTLTFAQNVGETALAQLFAVGLVLQPVAQTYRSLHRLFARSVTLSAEMSRTAPRQRTIAVSQVNTATLNRKLSARRSEAVSWSPILTFNRRMSLRRAAATSIILTATQSRRKTARRTLSVLLSMPATIRKFVPRRLAVALSLSPGLSAPGVGKTSLQTSLPLLGDMVAVPRGIRRLSANLTWGVTILYGQVASQRLAASLPVNVAMSIGGKFRWLLSVQHRPAVTMDRTVTVYRQNSSVLTLVGAKLKRGGD